MLAKLVAIKTVQTAKLSQFGLSISQIVTRIQTPQLKLIVKLCIISPHKFCQFLVFLIRKRIIPSIVIQETWPITQPHNTAHSFVFGVIVEEQLAAIV